MTRAEAIELLRELSNFVATPPETDEAINMAIEALEQEPCEDCISRERLRESLKKELVIVNNNEMYWQGWHDCTVAVETRITDAPSVVPKCGKWIGHTDEGYVECQFCHGATNCEGNIDELEFCFSCGVRME